jgi:hypothetical protein
LAEARWEYLDCFDWLNNGERNAGRSGRKIAENGILWSWRQQGFGHAGHRYARTLKNGYCGSNTPPFVGGANLPVCRLLSQGKRSDALASRLGNLQLLN